MRKILLVIIIVMLLRIVDAASAPSNSEFQVELLDSQVDFKTYDCLYINGIDVRGMGVTLHGTDGNKYRQSADETVLSAIASGLGDFFSVEMEKVIPLLEQDEEINNLDQLKGKRALIMDIKLMYDATTVQGDDPEISGGSLTIECVFLDVDAGYLVLKLSQSLSFNVEDTNRPFSGENERLKLEQLFESWALKTAAVIAGKRVSASK